MAWRLPLQTLSKIREKPIQLSLAWAKSAPRSPRGLGEDSIQAKDEAGFQGYAEKYLGTSEADYQAAVGGLEAIQTLPLPTY